jgi:glycosyltransferase involved in cell wall biosynthesis
MLAGARTKSGRVQTRQAELDTSVVIPVYNEEETITDVVREVAAAVGGDSPEVEILVVDDGSRDRTASILRHMREQYPSLRIITLAVNSGQTAALACGFLNAKGRFIVTLDGDGQSDPGDLPRIRKLLDEYQVVCGIRRNRRDSWNRRWGSYLANRIRRMVTGDRMEDICCPVKGFHAEPLQGLYYFDGSHRFLPVLLDMAGCKIVQVEVNHRPRSGGRSKYTNWRRLLITWQDLLAVRWMQKRHLELRIKDES